MINNILAKALSIIRPSVVSVRHFEGNVTNSVGIVVKSYTEWINVLGIVEPGIVSAFGGKNISEKDYKFMGLDWSRYYVTCWLDMAQVKNVHLRGGSDQIKYDGKTFTILQIANWSEYDKWQRCYCVEVDEDSEDSGNQGDGGSEKP